MKFIILEEMIVKAISIHQPWAWAILDPTARKTVENRTWPTSHRGALLIHASKSRASYMREKLIDWPAVYGVPLPPWGTLTTGAILGVVEVVDCLRLAEWRARRAAGCILAALAEPIMTTAWAEGPVCWILENPRQFVTPVPWRGQQGLFEVPDGKLPELARRSLRDRPPGGRRLSP